LEINIAILLSQNKKWRESEGGCKEKLDGSAGMDGDGKGRAFAAG